MSSLIRILFLLQESNLLDHYEEGSDLVRKSVSDGPLDDDDGTSVLFLHKFYTTLIVSVYYTCVISTYAPTHD